MNNFTLPDVIFYILVAFVAGAICGVWGTFAIKAFGG